jgi:hypothetical protein
MGRANVMKLRDKKVLWGLRCVLAALLASSTAHAGGFFKTLPDVLDREWGSFEVKAATKLDVDQLSLSPSDRFELLRKHLNHRGLHPLLNIVAKPLGHELKPYGEVSAELGLSVKEFVVRVGAYDVCKAGFRTVDASRGVSHVVGLVPRVEAVYPFHDDSWPDVNSSIEQASAAVHGLNGGSSNLTVTSVSRCLYPVSGELTPVWKIIVTSGKWPFVTYVGDSGLIEGDAMAFDAAAQVRAYHSNSRDSDPNKKALINFTVEVSGDGTLTNEYFVTAFGNSATRNQAPFDADQSSPDHFNEQSTFAHVNRQFQFVSQNGYVWNGPKPIKVFTSYPSNRDSNAQYIPFNGSTGPLIIIGPGKTGELTNLATDSDVVSHEFGHHVVYGSVTEVPSGSESLVIHEGLADALTFYASGDYCLGESICPYPDDAKKFCQVLGQCLRTANISNKYRDSAYLASGPHARGQVVSAMFADLKKSGKIPAENLHKLLIATITYLPKEATIKSLIVAVLDADFTLYNQQYSAILKDAAVARGMGIEDLGIDLADVDGKPPSDGTPKSKKDSGFMGLCSIGAVGAQSTASVLGLFVLFALPIIWQIVRKPVPAVVRKRKNKN